MKWDSFYGWSDAVQIKIAQMQTDFSDPTEVAEIGMAFYDEKVASKFINSAISAGVRFSADDIVELADYVDETALSSLLKHTNVAFFGGTD